MPFMYMLFFVSTKHTNTPSLQNSQHFRQIVKFQHTNQNRQLPSLSCSFLQPSHPHIPNQHLITPSETGILPHKCASRQCDTLHVLNTTTVSISSSTYVVRRWRMQYYVHPNTRGSNSTFFDSAGLSK